MRGLGLGLGGLGLAASKGVGYSAEANALFARFTTPPTAARKVLINNLIVALKTAGVWTKLDALYLTAAADSQAARQNWIANQYNLTEVNAPTFTADRGYAGNGSTSYLSTNFTASTAAGKMTQNSAAFAAWINSVAGVANSVEIGAGGVSSLYMLANGGLGLTAQINTNLSAVSGAIATALGFSVGLRTTATAVEVRKNAGSIATGSIASNALTSTPITLLANNGAANFSSRQLSAALFGAALSGTESDAAYTALNAYLTAVGGA